MNSKLIAVFATFVILFDTSFASAGMFHFVIQKKIEQKMKIVHAADDTSVTQSTFDQLIDHFTASNQNTFKQRYYISREYSKNNPTAPVFYYQCGEGNCIDDGGAIPGAIANYAQALGAAIVVLEHRYYGKSQPFADLSATSLQYLSYEQSLEDLAVFQRYAMANLNLGGKWIFAGGSYAGALSAYYRLKHPDLVVGALSSSGVVKTELLFEDYDRVVAQGLGTQCLAAVQSVTHQIEAVLNQPAALAKIQAEFQSEDVTSPLDFLSIVASMADGAVQYGAQTSFCNTILKAADPIAGYAQAGLSVFSMLGSKPLDFTFQGLASTAVADYEGDVGARQWSYQVCTEFGGFATPYHDPSLSAESSLLDLNYNMSGCKTLFGVTTAPNVDQTNQTFYEPLLDPSTSNIFFTNGSMDPYSILGIATVNGNVTNPNTTAFTLTGESHCADLSGGDAIVTEAQAEFQKLASQWLSK